MSLYKHRRNLATRQEVSVFGLFSGCASKPWKCRTRETTRATSDWRRTTTAPSRTGRSSRTVSREPFIFSLLNRALLLSINGLSKLSTSTGYKNYCYEPSELRKKFYFIQCLYNFEILLHGRIPGVTSWGRRLAMRVSGKELFYRIGNTNQDNNYSALVAFMKCFIFATQTNIVIIL